MFTQPISSETPQVVSIPEFEPFQKFISAAQVLRLLVATRIFISAAQMLQRPPPVA